MLCLQMTAGLNASEAIHVMSITARQTHRERRPDRSKERAMGLEHKRLEGVISANGKGLTDSERRRSRAMSEWELVRYCSGEEKNLSIFKQRCIKTSFIDP